MKPRSLLVLALGCLILISGCSSNSPRGKVKEFAKLAAAKDYEGILKLMPKEDVAAGSHDANISILSSDKELMRLGSYGVGSVDILKESEHDKSASVDANITLASDKDPTRYHFELTKEDGEWKIFKWDNMESPYRK